MAAPLLDVRDLKVHFPVRGGLLSRTRLSLKAVDGVSFQVAAGESLGIVGESGCGKSTLGRAVLQLIPATAGKVVWLGQDLGALDAAQMRERRCDLQVVFQDPISSLNPRMTVGDSIAEPLATAHPEMDRTSLRKRVLEALGQVGLPLDSYARYPHEFSGGQAQRIAIARAIIVKPKLVVCDEPVSALDVSIQAQIVGLLKRLQRETGMALIFISHDLSVVRYLCHRVMVLYLGRKMEEADRDSLFARPAHPYTQALIAAVPVADPVLAKARAAEVLPGDLPSPLHPPSGCVFRTRCPKAQDLCAAETPAWREPAPGRGVACHFPDA